jgi:ferredoxin
MSRRGEVRTQVQAVRHAFRFDKRFVCTLAWPRDRRARSIACGLCEGMCYAALYYMLAGVPLPDARTPPPWGAPLQRYLLQRQ